ncbi:MAG: alpha/beta hydrolase family protein [Opitutus sp.]
MKPSVAERWLSAAEIAPAFTVAPSLVEWERQRALVRAQLWQLLGQLPPRPVTPKVETLWRKDHGDHIVEKFQFDNAAGSVVSGYLFCPTQFTGKLPAILYCHWHAGEYDVGKEELLEARHTPEAPGAAYARRGYVVLAIDAPGFGERNGQGPDGPAEKDFAGEETVCKFELWVGRTFWGMMLRDDLIALDYLASRPEVDAARIGVTGMSMGATRTWWLMALDERLSAGVAIACMTRYQNLIRHGSIAQHHIGYFVPGMLNHFDSEAVMALIAPRPILFQTGDQDPGSPIDGIRHLEATVRSAYNVYGADQKFESLVYEGLGHVYTPQMWDRTFLWWETHLAESSPP